MIRNSVLDRQTNYIPEYIINSSNHLLNNGYKILDPKESTESSFLLAYSPHARNNMFQSLLYRNLWRSRFVPCPVADPFAFEELPWFGNAICHFHWLAGITEKPPQGSTAEENVARFESLLKTLRKQRRKIVWTVHNILPHDTRNRELAVRARELMTEYAHAIHIMSARTVELCAPLFQLDGSKVFHCPHPSYMGAYPDHIDRIEARFRLGLEPDSIVFLSFGAIQAYKGLPEMVDAYKAASVPNSRLVIAGPPVDEDIVTALRAKTVDRDDIVLVPARIPIEDVQLFYRAADVSLCPYLQTLNSGAAMLAMTFGVPVIAPDIGAFADIVTPGRGILYDAAKPHSLEEAIAAALSGTMAMDGEECLALADSLRPELVSEQFCRALLDAVGHAAEP